MFRFKEFGLCQERTAMKVGTDGTLLGAWAAGGEHILDVGTGTGLIALMMAQRFPSARVTAIELDADAVLDARCNVAASPFAERVEVVEGDVTQWDAPVRFDAIVSNPPFYDCSLESPNRQRTLARHTVSLTARSFFAACRRMLSECGVVSVVLPASAERLWTGEAALAGLSLSRFVLLRTSLRKPPKRVLLSFSAVPPISVERSEEVLTSPDGSRSLWYATLTHDFYLS